MTAAVLIAAALAVPAPAVPYLGHDAARQEVLSLQDVTVNGPEHVGACTRVARNIVRCHVRVPNATGPLTGFRCSWHARVRLEAHLMSVTQGPIWCRER